MLAPCLFQAPALAPVPPTRGLRMVQDIHPDKPAGPLPAPSSEEIAGLVGRVYASAPAEAKAPLLELLIRPLGPLALLAVAGGVFAGFRVRGGWRELQVHAEELQGVQPHDVVALADYAQQVSTEVLDGLSRWLAASPLLAGSAAAAALGALLLQRARRRAAREAGG